MDRDHVLFDMDPGGHGPCGHLGPPKVQCSRAYGPSVCTLTPASESRRDVLGNSFPRSLKVTIDSFFDTRPLALRPCIGDTKQAVVAKAAEERAAAKKTAARREECGGSRMCEHGRQRYYCKECSGGGICEQGRQRSLCKKCGGRYFPCTRATAEICEQAHALALQEAQAEAAVTGEGCG